MDAPVIELNALTKRYGTFTAVDHVDLTVKRGEIFGLLGPNGAGKSTTILMMLGLTEPTSGSVSVFGMNATTAPLEVKKRVGYLPDEVGFYDSYSGLENLIYTARLNRIPEAEAHDRAKKLLDLVGLAKEGNKKTGKYSRGMRQRLGLADVLIKKPEVIILDEPTLGIDPEGIRELLDLIVKLSRADGITVLLSSHQLHQVQKICDRVGLFVGGKLLAEGDIPALSARLFANEIFRITVRVGSPQGEEEEALQRRLKEVVLSIPGVTAAALHHDELQVSCSKDLTARIARSIVESGFDLLYLNHKEYGLDEIYHRYFEGGKTNGQK